MHQDHPELLKDQHWDDVFPSELPYTEATKQFQTQPFMGSTHNVEIPEGKSIFVPLEAVPEKGDDKFNCNNNPSVVSFQVSFYASRLFALICIRINLTSVDRFRKCLMLTVVYMHLTKFKKNNEQKRAATGGCQQKR